MSASLFHSSGDLIADRRLAFAQDLAARGDLAGAADVLAQAIEAAPRFVSAWFTLGEVRARLGERAAALAAFETVRSLDAADRLGAGLHLIRLGAAAPGTMPPAYVGALFDQYAARFDTALVDDLSYRGPAVVRAAVARACAATQLPPRFGSMLDLGCGTGLAGAAFRPLVDRITGVDLSGRMIAAATARGVYDRLTTGDLLTFLAAEAAAEQRYALIVAADVFPYVGELAPVLAAAARVLAPGGLLAFTVETHAGDGLVVGPALRYAHGQHDMRAALAGASLALLDVAEASIRTEAGVPAPGLVAVATPHADAGLFSATVTA